MLPSLSIDGHVDRVVALRVGDARQLRRLDLAGGLRRVDQLRAIDRARLVEQRVHRDFAEARIADVAQHVGVGELLRFDHHVQRVGAVEAVFARADTAPSG